MTNIGIISCGTDEFHRFMFGKYSACVTDCGASYSELMWDAGRAAEYAASCDGFILTGGGDMDPKYYGEAPLPQTANISPERDAFELAFIREAAASGKPVLGICRGLQSVNVALGGDLYQDYPSQRPDVPYEDVPRERFSEVSHSVAVESDSLLRRVTGLDSLSVNSLHHQAVRRPASGLTVSARTPEGLIEACELPERPFFLCVQWHPEHLYERDEPSRKIFASFVGACS